MLSKSASFRVYHLTDRLKLTGVLHLFTEKPIQVSGTEIVFQFAENQYLIIYNFGSVVFFDVDIAREAQIVTTLQLHVSPKDAIVAREDYSLEIGDKTSVEFKRVVLDNFSFPRIQIISLVLAQSAALDYYETVVGDVLEKSGRFTELLEKYGRIGRRRTKEVIKFIGFCLNTKQKVITTTSLLDSPDPTWEDPQLEQIYKQMVDMFEIKDRFQTLEYKIKTVQETVEILSDLLDAQQKLYLELTIIGLIALEVILFVLSIL